MIYRVHGGAWGMLSGQMGNGIKGASRGSGVVKWDVLGSVGSKGRLMGLLMIYKANMPKYK